MEFVRAAKCASFLAALLVGSTFGEELAYPFERRGVEGAHTEFSVEPGRAYKLNFEWREVNVPRTAYLMPHLRVEDAEGRVLLNRNVGMIQQRVFDPVSPEIQRWQVIAIANEADKPVSTTGFEGQSTVMLPLGSARMILSVSRYGSAAEIDQVHLGAKPVDPPGRIKCKFTPLPDVKRLSDKELDAELAVCPRHVARLQSAGDRTDLFVDDRRIQPKIYKNCPWDSPQRYRSAKVFGDAGFNIFTISFRLAEMWSRTGVDASALRGFLRKVLAYNPHAMIFLEMSVVPRPGWGEEHPDEVFRCESGRYGLFTHGRICAFTEMPKDDPNRKAFAVPSYTSELYGDEAAEAIGRVFEEMESWPESKAVIGVYVNGGTDGQWLDLFDNSALPSRESADYSVASQRGFDVYRKARGEDPVPIPSTAAFRIRNAVDFGEHAVTPESQWREFYVKAAAKMRLKFARAIKRATGRRILVGSYSPNTGLAGSALFAQTCAKWLIKSPDFDFFAVVPSYVREHVDPVVSAVYNGSLARNGKLFVSELDLRSGDVGNWGYWGSDFWKSNHTAGTFRNKVLHYVCHALTHGGAYHAYDMDGGWFNTPAAQETWKVANSIADHARPQKPIDDRIAVVSGERFMDHRSQGYGHMLAYALREMPRIALAVTGVPYDFYLVDDLLSDESAELPKVVLFTDLSTVGYDLYVELRRRYAKDGRVLVWFWRPGVYATDGSRIDKAFGMVRNANADGKWIVAAENSEDPLMRGVNGVFSAWYPYYADGIVFPDAYAPKGWKTLACYDKTNATAVSVRRDQGVTEVHIANPGQISAVFIRNLVREAGFEPLIETDDISGFGAGLFYVLSQKDGEKFFRMPKGMRPGGVLYGPSYKVAADGFSVFLKRNEMFILEVECE